jgi:hypothetical protein
LRHQILVDNKLVTNLKSQIATSNLSENEQDADWISHFATSNSVRILNIEQHQTETDEKVNQILVTIEERAPKQLPEQIF